MIDQILVLNGAEQPLAALSNSLPGACPILDARRRREAIEGGGYTDVLTVTVPGGHADAATVCEGNYLLYCESDGNWQEYRISMPVRTDEVTSRISATAEHVFYELAGEPIYDLRPTNTSAAAAVNSLLSGTRWQLGTADDLGTNSVRIYYPENGVLEGMVAIAARWGGELNYRLQVVGGAIAGRYVDILARRGQDTGKRCEIDKDLTSIAQTINMQPLCTALIGRGKGVEVSGGSDTEDPAYGRRLTIADVAWSIADGDPADKPLGQEWIGDDAARLAYGPGGSVCRHIFGYATFDDCTDAQELARLTYEELQRRKAPLVTYSLTAITLEAISGLAHEAVHFGDTMRVINTRITPAITGEARVITLDESLIDDKDRNMTLGNYIPTITRRLTAMASSQQAMRDRTGVWDRADVITPAESGGELEYMLDLLRVQLASTVSGVSTDENGNIIIENPAKTKAMMLGAGIFAIANSKSSGEYVWTTFGDGDGFVASKIVAGTMLADRVRAGLLSSETGTTWIDMDNGTFNFANKIIWNGSTLTFSADAIKAAMGPVGGRNLMRNSSGYLGTANWHDFFAGNAGDTFFAWDAATAAASLGINQPVLGIAANGNNQSYVFSDAVSCNPSTAYTLSFSHYTNQKNIEVYWTGDISGNHASSSYLGTGKKDASITFTTGPSDKKIWFLVANKGGTAGWSGAFWWNMMLTEGANNPTKWSPNPNELSSSTMEMTDKHIKMRTQQFLLELLNGLGVVTLSIDASTGELKVKDASGGYVSLKGQNISCYQGSFKTFALDPSYFRIWNRITQNPNNPAYIGTSGDGSSFIITAGLSCDKLILARELSSGGYTSALEITHTADSNSARMHVYENINMHNRDMRDVNNVYAQGNISALSFTDRTPWPENVDALEELRWVKGDGHGNIDHSTLPDFIRVRRVLSKGFSRKQIIDGEVHDVVVKPDVVEEERSLNGNISLLTIAAQQLDQRTRELAEKTAQIEELTARLERLEALLLPLAAAEEVKPA